MAQSLSDLCMCIKREREREKERERERERERENETDRRTKWGQRKARSFPSHKTWMTQQTHVTVWEMEPSLCGIKVFTFTGTRTHPLLHFTLNMSKQSPLSPQQSRGCLSFLPSLPRRGELFLPKWMGYWYSGGGGDSEHLMCGYYSTAAHRSPFLKEDEVGLVVAERRGAHISAEVKFWSHLDAIHHHSVVVE